MGIIVPCSTAAQSIANGGFETLIDCPPVFGPDLNIEQSMASWLAVQGTADGYHVSCPAIHPLATPGIPDVVFGSGFGALWGTSEVFGQQLDAPLDQDKNYCMELVGIAVDLVNSGVSEGDPCLQLCLYGSTVAPPPVTSWSIPIPVEDMPGTTLLTCSDPFSITEWTAHAFSFIPSATYPYLFFTSKQGADCNVLHPYLCLDDVLLTECVPTGIDGWDDAMSGLYPNPAYGSVRLGSAMRDAAQVRIYDLHGRLAMDHRVIDGSNAITLYDIPQGLYQLSAYDDRGRLLASERLFIQH